MPPIASAPASSKQAGWHERWQNALVGPAREFETRGCGSGSRATPYDIEMHAPEPEAATAERPPKPSRRQRPKPKASTPAKKRTPTRS